MSVIQLLNNEITH